MSVRRFLLAHRPLRRPVRRGRRVLFCALAAVLLAGLLLLWADAKVRPLVAQMAVARVHILASQMINNTVSEYVSAENLQYCDLVHFEKDAEGNITALKTDMAEVNAFKSAVLRDINIKLTDMKAAEIRIPLGNAINGELLSGRGPEIPIRLVPYGVVEAAFDNEFTAAGINQTRHQIVMSITVNIGVLLPGSATETAVTVQVNIAETVIVGRVPDTYANLSNANPLGLE
jgi:sporulation protein YunB